MTERVILALIKMSSKKGGSGAIIASTMPRTAIGTANWRQFAPTRGDAGEPGGTVFGAARAAGLAATRTLGVMDSLFADIRLSFPASSAYSSWRHLHTLPGVIPYFFLTISSPD